MAGQAGRRAGYSRPEAQTSDRSKFVFTDPAYPRDPEALHERLLAALDASGVGTWTWDVTADRVEWDAPLAKLYRIDPTHAPRTAEAFLELVHPDDRGGLSESIDRALRDQSAIEHEFRVRRGDGAVRWIYDRSKVVRDVAGRPLHMIGACLDITDRKRTETALADSESRLRLAIDAGRMAVWEYDIESDFIVNSPELNRLLGFPGDADPSIAELRAGFHPGENKRVRAAGLRAQAQGERFFEAEFRYVRPDSELRWLSLRAEFQPGPDGAARRVVGVLLDITEQKRALERQQLLIDELNHRVKNAMSAVQSIASQTLRHAATTEEARRTIEARILALSRAHDALNEQGWDQALVATVVDRVLTPLLPEAGRIAARGPEVGLAPRLSVDLALALHELVTNAIKYGALSGTQGRVTIEWRVSSRGDDSILHVDWTERGGPAIAAPSHTGFGSRLIRALAGQSGGECAFTFEEAGLRCELSFRLIDPAGAERAPGGQPTAAP